MGVESMENGHPGGQAKRGSVPRAYGEDAAEIAEFVAFWGIFVWRDGQFCTLSGSEVGTRIALHCPFKAPTTTEVGCNRYDSITGECSDIFLASFREIDVDI